jgi:hypothetical protein
MGHIIGQRYLDFVTQNMDWSITTASSFTGESFDVDIHVKSINQLVDCAAHPIKFTLLTSPYYCRIDPQIIQAYGGQVVGKTEVNQTDTNETQLMQVAAGFCRHLWRIVPDACCRFQLGNDAYYAHQGVFYIPDNLCATVTVTDDVVHIDVQGEHETHKVSDLCAAIQNGPGKDITPYRLYLENAEEVKRTPAIKIAYNQWKSQIEDKKATVKKLARIKKAVDRFRTSLPIIWLVMKVLLGLGTAIVTFLSIYALVKTVKKKKKPEPKDEDIVAIPEITPIIPGETITPKDKYVKSTKFSTHKFL